MLLRSGLVGILLGIFTSAAEAASLPSIGIIDPATFGLVIPQDVANEAVKMVASFAAHRPHAGAVALGRSNSVDTGIETTLVKISDGLTEALNANGIPLSTSTLPAIPVIKLHIRKALGEKADIGMSGLSYQGQSIYGGDLKFLVHDAEEGPRFATRFIFNKVNLPLAYVEKLYTYSIEILASQPLDFAETFIGGGVRYATGQMKIDVTNAGPPAVTTTLIKDGSSTSAYTFTGVNFRIPGPQGLRLGIEGGYDFSGYHTLGTMIGVGF